MDLENKESLPQTLRQFARIFKRSKKAEFLLLQRALNEAAQEIIDLRSQNKALLKEVNSKPKEKVRYVR